MLESQRRKIRRQFRTLLNTPGADENEIKRLGKILSKKDRQRSGPPRKKVLQLDPKQYIEMRNSGKTVSEIIAILGINEKDFYSDLAMLRERGEIKKGDIKRIPPKKNPRSLPLSKEQYLEDSKTMSDGEIAEKYIYTTQAIYLMRKRWGLPRRYDRTSLTYEEYKELKKVFRFDTEIERHLGYKPHTIRRLKAHKWVMLD